MYVIETGVHSHATNENLLPTPLPGRLCRLFQLAYTSSMLMLFLFCLIWRRQKVDKQESPAIAVKPARRESMPKIAPIRRAYNVVADNTGLSSCV